MPTLAGLDILEMTEKFFPCQEWNPDSSILHSILPALFWLLLKQSIQHLCTTSHSSTMTYQSKQILFSLSIQAQICIDIYSWEQLWTWPVARGEVRKFDVYVQLIIYIRLKCRFFKPPCSSVIETYIFARCVCSPPPPHKLSLVIIDRVHANEVIAVIAFCVSDNSSHLDRVFQI